MSVEKFTDKKRLIYMISVRSVEKYIFESTKFKSLNVRFYRKEMDKLLGEALKAAREYKHLTQKALGEIGFCSDKTISAVEKGKRNLSADVIGRMAVKLDYPRLYMEAVDQITGGVFSVPWLDGDNVDLHKSSVREKCIEELEQALRIVNLVKTSNNTKFCTESERELIKTSILETIDVFVASAHYIAIMGSEYDLSIGELFKEHRIKLIRKGYLKDKKRECL